MINTLSEIVSALKSFDTVTIISHIRPDGDTLGSAYALCYALQKCGKKVKVVCESEISPRYRFLSQGEKDINHSPEGAIVCVDVAAPDMAGKYSDYAKNADVVIDHHGTNSLYGKLNLVDADAAACGEIMLEIVKQLCPVDKLMAECLYTAISTDTGCFVYANTTSSTHRAAAELISCGIDVAALNKNLFRTKSPAALEIERRALDSVKYYYDGRIISMKISLDWITELSACEDDLESISSIPAQIQGVDAAATFREIAKDTYKVSVRTNGEVDGGAVCKALGGGGHKMAAGCTLTGDFDSVRDILVQKLFEGMKQ